jgi:dihydroorotate dehydrogenase (NAD+) catalytic subunit
MMEDKISTVGLRKVPADALSEIVMELGRRISFGKLAEELEVSEDTVRHWKADKREYSPQELWRIVRSAYKYGFFDLLTEHGVPPISYDITAPFNLLAAPLGADEALPVVPLIKRPTEIAGFPVDFPLGLPASVLAANSKWIEFYALRGFDILTYKTVRSVYRKEHPWPNWVFLRDPAEMLPPFDQKQIGFPDFWPSDLTHVSMGNSFGIPSLAPEAWEEDVRRARAVVREGHQVLIVSVTASKNDRENAIEEDFVATSVMAKNAGADIVEANYSCPNVPGDPIGEVYQKPEFAGRISRAIKKAIGPTPLFIKIGYLALPQLQAFLQHNAEWIDGLVAINTISTNVVDDKGSETFPGRPRAGISGWAIKARAHEVARSLVTLRPEIERSFSKRFALLGVGGVITAQDVDDFLAIGVDAVESCTGAFLNPLLGLDVRLDREALKGQSSRFSLEFRFLKQFLDEIFRHPTKTSHIKVDEASGTISVERR